MNWPTHPKYPGVPASLFIGRVKLLLWRGRPLTLNTSSQEAFQNWMARLMPDLTVIPAVVVSEAAVRIAWLLRRSK